MGLLEMLTRNISPEGFHDFLKRFRGSALVRLWDQEVMTV
jgi:hypothetical protein